MTQFRYLNPSVIQNAAKSPTNVYPYAEYRPIPEASSQPAIHPWSFIFHTMGGPNTTTPNQLWLYWNRGDVGVEAHLALGYGSLVQALPFNVRGDNNTQANRFWIEGVGWVGAISVETQDNGYNLDPGIAKAPWNQFQMEHLAGVSAFLRLRYGIPIARCVTWNGRGIEGHRRFPEWTGSARSCPGNTRWAQIPTILAWANEIVSYTPAAKEPVIIHDPPLRQTASPRWIAHNNPTFIAVPGARPGADGVMVNLTVIGPADNGHLVAWSGVGGMPSTSNVNFGKGQTVANSATVKLVNGGFVIETNVDCALIVDLMASVMPQAA